MASGEIQTRKGRLRKGERPEDLRGISARLEALANEVGLEELSKRSGIPEQTIRNWIRGTRVGLHQAAQIAQAAGVRLEWLATGRGPMREGEEAGGPVVVEKPEEAPEGWVAVPRHEVTVGAGDERIPIRSELIVDYWAFRRDWLERQGIRPGRAALVEVAGDSMEPLLRPGDLVLVDLAAVDGPLREGLWVVWLDQGLLVKRLQVLGGGRLRLVSENPHYRPLVVVPARHPGFRLVGLVRWMARRV